MLTRTWHPSLGSVRCRPRPVAWLSTQPAADSGPREDKPERAESPNSSDNSLSRPKRERVRNTRTVLVRPWDGVSSMPDAFAILRALERKYGRVREVRFVRDFEVAQSYNPIFRAEFESAESFERVPVGSEVIQVEATGFDPTKEGGPGLDDLQNLLHAQDRTEDAPEWQSVAEGQDDEKPKLLDVKVERSVLPLSAFTTSTRNRDRPMPPTQGFNRALGHAFVGFGGFSTDQTRPNKEMDAALEKWGKIAGRSPASAESASGIVGQDSNSDGINDGTGSGPIVAQSTDGQHIPAGASSQMANEPPPTDWEPLPPPPTASLDESQSQSDSSSSSPSDSSSTLNKAHPSAAPHVTRRQRLLMQAQENARTPLPDPGETSKEMADKRERDKKRKQEERDSFKERLWGMVHRLF